MANHAIEELRTRYFTRHPNLIANNAVKTIYAFSNENLRQYFMHLKLKDARVATVGSSGDQAFNAIYYGAKDVTLIDANPYAKPLVELKASAIKNMTYKEFMKYWSFEEILDESCYKDLLGDVSEDTREFLQEFLGVVKSAKSRYLAYASIIDDSSFSSITEYKGNKVNADYSKGSEIYDNETNFNIMKKLLHESSIDYKLAEFSDFPQELSDKYDSILISNIYNYYLEQADFFRVAKSLIDDNLASGGTMQMHYNMSRHCFFKENMGLYLPEYNECKKYILNKTIDNGLIDNSFVGRVKERVMDKFARKETNKDRANDEVFIYEKD